MEIDRHEGLARRVRLTQFLFLSRLLGSTPGLVLKSISEELYESSSSLTFGSYMAVVTPTVIVNLFILWALFQVFTFGCSSFWFVLGARNI